MRRRKPKPAARRTHPTSTNRDRTSPVQTSEEGAGDFGPLNIEVNDGCDVRPRAGEATRSDLRTPPLSDELHRNALSVGVALGCAPTPLCNTYRLVNLGHRDGREITKVAPNRPASRDYRIRKWDVSEGGNAHTSLGATCQQVLVACQDGPEARPVTWWQYRESTGDRPCIVRRVVGYDGSGERQIGDPQACDRYDGITMGRVGYLVEQQHRSDQGVHPVRRWPQWGTPPTGGQHHGHGRSHRVRQRRLLGSTSTPPHPRPRNSPRTEPRHSPPNGQDHS